MPKSYYLYISSKNRSSQEKTYKFNVNIANPIICNKNQSLNVSVIGFSMLNSDYNLKNCLFYIQELHTTPIIYSQLHTITIPNGNYNYQSLLSFLNNYEDTKNIISYEYIKERNCFKFINKLQEGELLIIPNNCSQFIGVYEQLTVSISQEGFFINLCNYSHIIIKSTLLDFEDNAQDNIGNKKLVLSNMLFMIDKQDIQPFQLITYRNYDNGDNFSYNINNKMISIIDLHLYNEKDELLTDTSDYFIILKFVINDNKQIFNPMSILEDIKFLLMTSIFNGKNKNLLL